MCCCVFLIFVSTWNWGLGNVLKCVIAAHANKVSARILFCWRGRGKKGLYICCHTVILPIMHKRRRSYNNLKWQFKKKDAYSLSRFKMTHHRRRGRSTALLVRLCVKKWFLIFWFYRESAETFNFIHVSSLYEPHFSQDMFTFLNI